MINNLLSKKLAAIGCAAALSVASVAVAFSTAGDYSLAGTSPSSSASATTTPTATPEDPTKPVEPTAKPEDPTKPVEPTATPTSAPTSAPTTAPTTVPTTTPSEIPVVKVSYSVVGPLVASIVGEDKQWDDKSAVEMIQSETNAQVYTLTIKDVEPKTYEYQVLKDHSWSNKYSGTYFGDSSYDNLKVVVPEKMDITVTLDLDKMTVKTNLDSDVPTVDMSAATVTLEKSKVAFNNAKQSPVVKSVVLGDKTLVADTDYTVKKISVSKAGTYTVTVNGTGKYYGSASAKFTVVRKSIGSAKVTVAPKTYTGKKLTSSSYSVKIKLNGKTVTLKKNRDYTVKAASLSKAGSATVKFTGKGNYTGTKSAKFLVKAKKLPTKKITVKNAIYTGKTVKSTVVVKDGSKTLKNGRDYTVKFSGKKIGKATVTIKGKGNYTGTVKKTIKVVPGTAKIKSVKNSKAGKATVTFGKVKGATSYTVSYRIKGAKKWSKVTTKKSTVVLSKLKKGKTYQVTVTASAKAGKTTYKGTTSSVKTVKIKK